MVTRKRKLYKVRATNMESGRVDYHHNLTRWDLEWLKSMANLKVEILEVENREKYEKRS
jgi:hypothetical protein